MKRFLFQRGLLTALSLTILVGSGGAQDLTSAPKPIEKIEFTTYFEQSSRKTNDGKDNSIYTYKDKIYAAWIDDNLNMVVGKYDESGKVVTTIVATDIADDRYHVRPSLAVDSDGFIHVTGGMHHNFWNYYVSSKPEDISSFVKVTGTPQCPPGTGISYPNFYKDNSGKLYITYRHRVGGLVGEIKGDAPDGFMPGDLAGAIAKYDTKTKTWKMLGGKDYRHGRQTLVWFDGGALYGWYNSFKLEMAFDKNNRIHIAWLTHTIPTQKVSSDNASYLMYAYSDDEGETFHKIDGTKITQYPITPETGSVVLERLQKADINNGLSIGATSDGRPIVGGRIGETGVNVRIWSGTSWEKLIYPKAQAQFYTSAKTGRMIAILYREGKTSIIYSSDDNGVTWITGPEVNFISFDIDRDYFNKTGNLNFIAMDLEYRKVVTGKITIKP